MGHYYGPNGEDGDTISKNGGPSSNTPIGLLQRRVACRLFIVLVPRI